MMLINHSVLHFLISIAAYWLKKKLSRCILKLKCFLRKIMSVKLLYHHFINRYAIWYHVYFFCKVNYKFLINFLLNFLLIINRVTIRICHSVVYWKIMCRRNDTGAYGPEFLGEGGGGEWSGNNFAITFRAPNLVLLWEISVYYKIYLELQESFI